MVFEYMDFDLSGLFINSRMVSLHPYSQCDLPTTDLDSCSHQMLCVATFVWSQLHAPTQYPSS
jgi:hypothetical protein